MFKKIVKKLFNSVGLDIRRRHKPKYKIRERVPNKLEFGFAKNDSYSIDYTEVQLDGNSYFLPKYCEHRPAVKCFLDGKLYEPLTHDFVSRYCSEVGGSIVHAGAFFGDMLPNFSNATESSVYAFEPVLENFVLAKLCVEKNHLGNVLLQNAALSDSITNLYINPREDDSNHAGGGSKVSDTGLICSAVTIDSLNASDISLIQLDVEGHELSALRGADNTISKCRPVIMIEDNNNECPEFLISQSYELYAEIKDKLFEGGPGLNLWIPMENANLRNLITNIIG